MPANHSTNWEVEVDKELYRAEQARSSGNEGMARVCARRAASVALGKYFNQRGFPNVGASVIERIKIFNSLPETSSRAREVTNHLLLRVNEDHKLPIDIDLIEETRWLADYIHLQLKIE